MRSLPIISILMFSFCAAAKVKKTAPKEPKTRPIINTTEKYKFTCPDLKIDLADGRREALEPLRDRACDKIEITTLTGQSFEKIAAREGMGEIKVIEGKEKFKPLDSDVKEYTQDKYRMIYRTSLWQCGYENGGVSGHGPVGAHSAVISNGVRTVNLSTTEDGECGDDTYLMTMEEFESIIKSFAFTD